MIANSKADLIPLFGIWIGDSGRTDHAKSERVRSAQDQKLLDGDRKFMVLQNLIAAGIEQLGEVVAAENSDSPEVSRRPKQTDAGPKIFKIECGGVPIAEKGGSSAELKLQLRIDVRRPVKKSSADQETVGNRVAPSQGHVVGVETGNAAAQCEIGDLLLGLQDLLFTKTFILRSGVFSFR